MSNVILKELREKKGYTQSKISNELGITGDYVNMIENGRRTPGFKLAKRIADFLGATVDELFFCQQTEHDIRE